MSLAEIRAAAGLGPLACCECRAFGEHERGCAYDGTMVCSRWPRGPLSNTPADAERTRLLRRPTRPRDYVAEFARVYGVARGMFADLGDADPTRAARLSAWTVGDDEREGWR